jgi:4'-phosphopantetheinyl transferase
MTQLFTEQTYSNLEASEIHVWSASLDVPVLRFWRVLSPDEKIRAEQYRFPDDVRSFIVRRGILRMLLGRYLNLAPGQIRLNYGKNGKPWVNEPSMRRKIHFNLSHSEGLALYVFTFDDEIGVDIECVKDIPGIDQIAELYFTSGERQDLSSLPESEKKEEFFNIWTRKEAVLKAVGDGLSGPAEEFEVLMAPAGSERLLGTAGTPVPASWWSIYDLKPGPGYSAAFAMKKPPGRVICWEWTD